MQYLYLVDIKGKPTSISVDMGECWQPSSCYHFVTIVTASGTYKGYMQYVEILILGELYDLPGIQTMHRPDLVDMNGRLSLSKLKSSCTSEVLERLLARRKAHMVESCLNELRVHLGSDIKMRCLVSQSLLVSRGTDKIQTHGGHRSSQKRRRRSRFRASTDSAVGQCTSSSESSGLLDVTDDDA